MGYPLAEFLAEFTHLGMAPGIRLFIQIHGILVEYEQEYNVIQ